MVAGRKEDFVSSRNLPLTFALRLGGPVSAFIVRWRPERPSSRPHADDLLLRRKSSRYMPLSTLDARIRIRDWFLDPLLRSFVPLMIASPPLDDKGKKTNARGAAEIKVHNLRSLFSEVKEGGGRGSLSRINTRPPPPSLVEALLRMGPLFGMRPPSPPLPPRSFFLLLSSSREVSRERVSAPPYSTYTVHSVVRLFSPKSVIVSL